MTCSDSSCFYQVLLGNIPVEVPPVSRKEDLRWSFKAAICRSPGWASGNPPSRGVKAGRKLASVVIYLLSFRIQ
jgi:hypothetical protein